MDLHNLSDPTLADLRRRVFHEIERRTKANANGNDASSVIYGQEMAKRALVVAAAGKHSILFVGPPNCGKTMLRAVALQLGLSDTFEARFCPCGYSSHPQIACSCTARQTKRHRAKYPVTDITVEVPPLSQREISSKGTGLAEMRAQIKAMTAHVSATLDEGCRHLLQAAAAELGLDTAAFETILFVARTIANLDRSEHIQPPHLCEAINYRPFR
jgi:magnesium chelatase family protein